MEPLRAFGFFILLVLTSISTTHSSVQPSYLVVTPNAFRLGSQTSVLVTVLASADVDADVSVDVDAEITQQNDTLTRASIRVFKGSTEELRLPPIYEVPAGRPICILRVRGYVGNNTVFSNTTQINLDSRLQYSFIQVDKERYLPGQVVRIRVVSILPDGKPDPGPVNITIQDPRGNMIRQWLNLRSVLGVWSEELQLSDFPPMGHWTINALKGDIVTEKGFVVAHYVLPKFKVVINVQPFVYYEDILTGSVTATFTFGKPVTGYMRLTFIFQQRYYEIVKEDECEFEGTEDFTFDVSTYMKVARHDVITIVAIITEKGIGLTYNNTATVKVAKHRYKLSFLHPPQNLKPPLPFRTTLKISRYDDGPLSEEDQAKTIEVSVTDRWDFYYYWETSGRAFNDSLIPHPPSSNEHFLVFSVPANGLIPLTFNIRNNTYALYLHASIEDSRTTLTRHRFYYSPSHSYLQIHKTFDSWYGPSLILHVETNFQTDFFYFIVMSKGEIVFHGQSTSKDIELLPEESWAPRACIIVYCVHPNGEIVNDVIQLPMTQILKNKVYLRWSEDMRKPAENVSLRVSVKEPGSVVWILAVDKAARSASAPNDITEDMVYKTMANDSDSEKSDSSHTNAAPYFVFKACDLVVLTDANLIKYPYPVFYYYDMFPPDLAVPFENGQVDPVYQDSQDYQDEPLPDGDEEPRVRQDFPETWLWEQIHTGDSTTAEVNVTVPDSITTWVTSAFVMSRNLGLGFMQMPAELAVFQEFFLALSLPAFVIRGEEFILKIFLMNYISQPLMVTVTVVESDAFEFIDPDSEDFPGRRRVPVKSLSNVDVLIPIRPLVIGPMVILVKAVSYMISDAVSRIIQVKPEGLEQSYSSAQIVELYGSSFSFYSHFNFPANVVEGSQRAEVTAVGDVLGPSIEGLESLIKLPYGCGEQNMINFAPNIYILQYLSASGRVDKEIMEKSIKYMLKGYEREMSYQRGDGSFSAFGDRDSSGSTWLSAFVLRCFLQARSFINIEARVLHRVASWLLMQQNPNGSFHEPGRVLNTALQGGLEGPVSLTAYVFIALLEDDVLKTSSQVSEALIFLETSRAKGVSSNYSLCLLSYALALADSPNASAALNELIQRADMRDGVPSWTFPHSRPSRYRKPRTTDIEMVSYVLLTQARLGRLQEGLTAAKWLAKQRNNLGGYGSTQDTVMALQALSIMASVFGSENTDLDITVLSDPSTTVASFSINEDNFLLYQRKQIDVTDDVFLHVTAGGNGVALFQLNVFYNIRSSELLRRKRDADEDEAFYLHVEMSDKNVNSADVEICTRLLESADVNITGMAMIEAGLISGLTLAEGGVVTDAVIKNVEVQQGKVNIYLDSVSREQICVKLPLVLEHQVGKVQDATVKVYDYYNPSWRAERSYTSELRREMSASAFCDNNKCKPEDEPPTAGAPQTCRRPLLTALPLTLLLLLF